MYRELVKAASRHENDGGRAAERVSGYAIARAVYGHGAGANMASRIVGAPFGARVEVNGRAARSRVHRRHPGRHGEHEPRNFHATLHRTSVNDADRLSKTKAVGKSGLALGNDLSSDQMRGCRGRLP